MTNQIWSRTATLLTATLTPLLLLTACSQSETFEKQLDDLVSQGATFKLPREVDNGISWQDMLVVCPYAPELENVDPAFIEAASTIDSDASDDSQWLLFRSDSDVTTVVVPRATADFCAGGPIETTPLTPDTLWQPSLKNGVMTVTPLLGEA